MLRNRLPAVPMHLPVVPPPSPGGSPVYLTQEGSFSAAHLRSPDSFVSQCRARLVVRLRASQCAPQFRAGPAKSICPRTEARSSDRSLRDRLTRSLALRPALRGRVHPFTELRRRDPCAPDLQPQRAAAAPAQLPF